MGAFVPPTFDLAAEDRLRLVDEGPGMSEFED